ncbi:YgiT-type zinc finger protein [Senegalia massiliensis]|uniref:YgiT-type zinc finger protein n=1 Tax=Senegalia massiliensis TaxID=1720316 RepID=UPI00102F5ED0|nr:YgiT-type zinc finger protein [Senegalia massiliensis]
MDNKLRCFLCGEELKEGISDVRAGWGRYRVRFYGVRALICEGCGDTIFSKYDVYIVQSLSKLFLELSFENRPKKMDLTNIYDLFIEDKNLIHSIDINNLNLYEEEGIFSFDRREIEVYLNNNIMHA